jgi:hypothetical protein
MMQGLPPLPSPIKWIFYLSNEVTNLHHEVNMQFSHIKKKIMTKMPYVNLNGISFSREQGFVLGFNHLTFVRINVVSYLVSFW